ncbi:hypothetical protein JCM17960_14440 [Magnetospira thiophila]
MVELDFLLHEVESHIEICKKFYRRGLSVTSLEKAKSYIIKAREIKGEDTGNEQFMFFLSSAQKYLIDHHMNYKS